MLSFLKPYLWGALAILILAILGYGAYLQLRVTSLADQNQTLQTENGQLAVDVKSYKDQVDILSAREQQSKIMEADYANLKKQIDTKKGGPVGDALRYAVEHDILHKPTATTSK